MLSNVPLALYASIVHQRGVIEVMSYLQQEGLEGRVDGIFFLMPCHSTPLQSHLHLNVPVKYITCEPPLKYDFFLLILSYLLLFFACRGFLDTARCQTPTPSSHEDHKTYQDESDIFYDNPVASLKAGIIPSDTSHLVLFEALLPQVREVLEELGYSPRASFFNTHFSDDSRREGHVLVWKKTSKGHSLHVNNSHL